MAIATMNAAIIFDLECCSVILTQSDGNRTLLFNAILYLIDDVICESRVFERGNIATNSKMAWRAEAELY